MRNLLPGLVGPCCCVLLCALVGCGSDSAQAFGTMGFDGAMATGGARGGPLDGGAEHPSASGGMVGSSGGGGEGGGGGAGSGGAISGTGGAVAASGGASGTGGVTSSGGVTGSGGNGSDTCDQLDADYQKEMPRARMCTLGIGSTQCQHAVPTALGCGGGCITYVQEPGKLDELKQKWASNNCDARIRACSAVACISAQPGNCYVSGSVTTPQCQSRPVL
ncbi:MAG: hypothetical protein ABJA82_19520 [Myxococcales bacterium]